MKKKFSKILGVGLALVLVVSFSLVTAVPAGAIPPQTVLWGVTGVNFGGETEYSEIFTVDTTTGTVTIIGGVEADPLYSDIAITPNGNLYAVGRNTNDNVQAPNQSWRANFNDFFRLDPGTGAVLEQWLDVFTQKGFMHVNALSAESDTSLLAIEGGGVGTSWGDPDGPRLLRITLDDLGDLVDIKSLGFLNVDCSDGDLDRDPATGKWYAGFWKSGNVSEMWKLNLADPSNSTAVSDSQMPCQGGFAFRSDGTAYAGSWADENLYTVDVLAGGSTVAYDLSAALGGNIFGLSSQVPTEVWIDGIGDDGNLGTELLPFATIQRGIKTVAESGTVNVAAGTYDAFDANKDGITVQTAGAEITANPITVDGQVNAIVVSAHNVTIDGFTIDDPLFSTGIKIYSATTPPYGAVIKKNVIDFTSFDPNTMAGCTYGGGCIQVKAGSGATTIIEDNDVAFNQANTWGHEGIASWGMHNADVIIRGNTVDISNTGAGAVNKYHNGITLHGTNGGSALIHNNPVSVVALGNGMWRHYGIYILGNGAIGEHLNNVTITNNTVTGPGFCSWAGKSTGYALRMSGPDTNNIDIKNNEFKDYEFGMVVENNASCNDVHVNYNNIIGNDHGIVTGVTYTITVPTLDATNNWWGSASGPTHASNTYTVPAGTSQGNAVSDFVNFVPWNDTDMMGMSFAPVKNVTDEPDSLFSSIQAAIDAAQPNDIISVAAGTYTPTGTFLDHAGLKFLDATKSGITLSGANAGKPGTGMRGDESIIEGPRVLHGNAIYIFDGADGVKIDGFTLRAYDDIVENRADNVVIENNIIEPLPSSSLTGTLTFTNGSNIVTGSGTSFTTELAVEWKIMLDADEVWVQVGSIESDTSLTLEWGPYTDTGGTGAGSTHPDANAPGIFACEANNLTVRNNLIQAGGCGIFLGLWPGQRTNPVIGGLIEYNLIDNTGFTGILAYDTDNILISHNTIRDVGKPGNLDDGIRAGGWGSGLTIEYNDISGCTNHGIQIKHDAATHTIRYNNIFGNQYGLKNTDTSVVDATRNWWKHASGPSHKLPHGKWLGKGDKVSDNVEYTPWLHKSKEKIVPSKEPAYAQRAVLDNFGDYGWNTFSAPIFLDEEADTWKELWELTDLDYSIAYRFDPAAQDFVLLTDEYAINPGEGFFIKMDDVGSLAILYSTEENLMPPSRPLTAGWNLIGLASLEDMGVGDAFASIATAPGLAGYSQVVSPIGNAVPGPVLADGTIYVGESYWVYMLGERTLAGFTMTPVDWEP